MNSPYRCVASITANFTYARMNAPGGRNTRSSHSALLRLFGRKVAASRSARGLNRPRPEAGAKLANVAVRNLSERFGVTQRASSLYSASLWLRHDRFHK